MEITGQSILVPPYFENFGKRLIISPKVYFGDPGLACYLLGIRTQAELDRSPFLGALFEGLVAAEILKSQVNLGQRKELCYFRDRQGLEVDFLFPGGRGGLWMVESKPTKTVVPAMAAQLLALRKSARERAPVRLKVVHRRSATAPSSAALAPGVEALDERRFVTAPGGDAAPRMSRRRPRPGRQASRKSDRWMHNHPRSDNNNGCLGAETNPGKGDYSMSCGWARLAGVMTTGLLLCGVGVAAEIPKWDYRVLATSRTSTMEKEMNEAADAGFRMLDVMGGGTAIGGKEVVVIMGRELGATAPIKVKYKLLATQKTGTMQKELQQAGDEGFEYCGQTVFGSAFGGQEVTVILERNSDTTARRIEYKLLATSRTSTMQKELQQVGEDGFRFKGLTVSKSAFGGSETITILAREARP